MRRKIDPNTTFTGVSVQQIGRLTEASMGGKGLTLVVKAVGNQNCMKATVLELANGVMRGVPFALFAAAIRAKMDDRTCNSKFGTSHQHPRVHDGAHGPLIC